MCLRIKDTVVARMYMRAKLLSRVQLLAILWTVALQAPLSMGLSRQEYWNGLSCPPSGALPDPRIEPTSLKSPALADRFFIPSATWEAPVDRMLPHQRYLCP